MKKRFKNALLLLLLIKPCFAFAEPPHNNEDYSYLCRNIYIDKPSLLFFKLSVFDKNEKLLICGSDSPGWKNIPENQALGQLKLSLEAKGYFDYQILSIENKNYLKLGDKRKIQDIQFLEAPLHFFDSKFLGVEGNVLSPKSLDTIEAWTKTRLKSLGYPCPLVEIKASSKTGQVKVFLKPGKQQKVESIKNKGLEGIDPRAVERFRAFEMGDLYNGTLMDLTSRRVISSGLADFASFQHQCLPEQKFKGPFIHDLQQGNSRNIVVIAGASTQEFPILKLKWNLFRLDKMASQNRAQLHLSNREQSLENEFIWYVFSNFPRFSLVPRFKLNRFSESFFESFRQSYEVGFNFSHDDNQKRLILEIQPAYNQEKTIRGQGPENTSFFSLESRASIVSHLYEFYQTSPRSGYQLGGAWWTRKKGVGSSINGDRYEISGTGLFNWGGFDPPLFILGGRFKAEWLKSPRLEDSPPSMRLYLGGDDDLRGFNRKSINNEGLGFNSLLYVGLEARVSQWLPYKIQPLIFMDGATVQAENTSFNELLFWSPGVGVRWGSPFGAIRFTMGYGFIEGDTIKQSPKVKEQWTYFVSFGREF